MESGKMFLGAFGQSCPHSQKRCLLSKQFWQGASIGSPDQGFWKLASFHLPEPQEEAGRLLPFVTGSDCLLAAVRESPNTQCPASVPYANQTPGPRPQGQDSWMLRIQDTS